RLNHATWPLLISPALRDDHPPVEATTFSVPAGEFHGLHWRVPRVDRSFEHIDRSEERASEETLPDGILRPLPPQAALSCPLSPSG
ncbi:hypothetical protein ACC773_36740, partial [Rhizobium ruizarguesonis]